MFYYLYVCAECKRKVNRGKMKLGDFFSGSEERERAKMRGNAGRRGRGKSGKASNELLTTYRVYIRARAVNARSVRLNGRIPPEDESVARSASPS